jgi:yeast amino acid transporter
MFELTNLLLMVDWKEAGWKEFLVTGPWGRLAGFWACCCQACLAYIGTEIIGMTADETERPRETFPKAVRRVASRITFYYVGAIFVLGLNVSSNDPILASYVTSPQATYQGPFVLMVQRANIRGLAHLLNALTIVAALAVANVNLYVAVVHV